MLYSVLMAQELMEEGEHLSDEEVLSRSLKHPALFALLVRRYEAPFLRKAQSILHDPAEAEDIVQEAFTKIYLNAAKFKSQEGASFSSWAWKILMNTSFTHYSKARRRQGMDVRFDDEIWALIPEKERAFEKNVSQDLVASVLVRMSPAFARILSLFFLEGLPQEEIARREGMSVGAVKTRVHRAKKEFRRIYESLMAK